MNVATRLAHEPASVSEARQIVDKLEATLDEETVATVRLLVSELVTNSVRHGGADDAGDIELSVSASSDSVRVAVADSGCGFAPRPRVDGQDEGSGWGIHLLDALSDRWGTERDARMRIWFEINRGRPAEAAEDTAQTTLSSPPASDDTSARKALESDTR